MAGEKMPFFERYLTWWVIACIIGGITIGKLAGSSISGISEWTLYSINIPVAVLVWLMIFPMMVQIDFSSITHFKRHGKGLALTLTINWFIKPFSMAFFAWFFFSKLYAAWITSELAGEYIAGAILLGAAPCTAMVFVWSFLTKGDANFTLVQVSINDLVLLVAFIPIVQLLLGITSVSIPFDVLLTSVVAFVVIPLMAGYIVNQWLLKTKSKEWFKTVFLPRLRPVSIVALLSTLVLLFAFQGEQIVRQPFNILLIAVPLIVQTYFIFFLTWNVGRRWLKVPHCINAPAGLIGASNFFELSVAVAISIFGLNSGAALVTVVGVLIEVPIMLSLVKYANKHQYD